jgi:exosortase
MMEDLRELWLRLPHKAVFLVGLLGWCLLFHWMGNATFGYVDTPSIFAWMINAYNAPLSEDGHGNLIPFVVLALLLWKRQELLAIPSPGLWWPAFLCLILGLGLHIVGYMAQQTRLSVLGLFVGFYGLIGFCWGKAWMRSIFFPYILLLFCIPVGSLAQPITFPLRQLVTFLAATIAKVGLQVDVVRDGTFLTNADRTFSYNVAAACSGIRSLMSLVPLTLAFGFIVYKAWWRRLTLLLLSVPLAVIGNTLRLVIAVWLGSRYGQEVGLKWETNLGFITFPIAIGGIMLADRWLKEPPEIVSNKEVAS